jgi:carboxyl-terminal processing protease
VTVAKYETPHHKDIHKLGIVPDVLVSQPPLAFPDITSPQDRQYQAALECLTQPATLAQGAVNP